ncbi:MAG TPA: hypothetical protein VIY86_06065 [Pirellulaceae bacterium]
MEQRHKRALEPFAIVLAGIDMDLDEKTESELSELLEACEAASDAACWPYTQRAAEFLGPELRRRLQRIAA